jgi:hypothetical protein
MTIFHPNISIRSTMTFDLKKKEKGKELVVYIDPTGPTSS